MSGTARTGIAILILAFLCGATYLLVKNNGEKADGLNEPVPKTYSSAKYGFSFSFDAGYRLVDFPSDQYVNIEKAGEEPNEVVSVAVEIAGEEQEFADFQDFVHERAKLFCAADGPGGSLYCERVTRTEPFTAATGARGEVFYLEMTHEIRGEGSSAREVGPFYAFDLTPDGGSSYTALIIRPSQFYDESEMYDEGAKAANDIVNTLVLTR